MIRSTEHPNETAADRTQRLLHQINSLRARIAREADADERMRMVRLLAEREAGLRWVERRAS